MLLSGGVESTTLLHSLAADGTPVRALFVDEASAAAREKTAAAWQCRRLRVPLKTLDLRAIGRGFRTDQALKRHAPCRIAIW